MEPKTRRILLDRLNRDAKFLAGRFGLRYKAIQAERANVKNRYGVCYSDGLIKIRLRHATTGKPLKYSSLVSTLCHELAHLRHFNHGLRFRAFNQEILEFAREQGIYRPERRRLRRATDDRRASDPPQSTAAPARERSAPPETGQLSLF